MPVTEQDILEQKKLLTQAEERTPEEAEAVASEVTEDNMTIGDVMRLGGADGINYVPDVESKVKSDKVIKGDWLDVFYSALFGATSTALLNMPGDKFEMKSRDSEEIFKEFDDLAKNARIMQVDKEAGIQKIQEKISEAKGVEKIGYAVAAAVAEQGSFQSFPQVAAMLDQDPVASAVYNSTNITLGIAKNVGLSLFTGGALPAIAGFQAFDSSFSMYNTMGEVRDMNPNADISPEIYAAAAGVASIASFGLSEMFGRYAINKVLQNQAKSVFQRALSGGIRNASEYTMEHYIRNAGLATADQNPLDYSWFALATAFTMGAAFDIGREQYHLALLKEDPISFKADVKKLKERMFVFKAKGNKAEPLTTDAIQQPEMPETDIPKGKLTDILLHNVDEQEVKGIQNSIFESILKDIDESLDLTNVDHARLIGGLRTERDVQNTIRVNTKGMYAKRRYEVQTAMTDKAVQNVRSTFDSEPDINVYRQELRNKLSNAGGVYRHYFDEISKGEFASAADFASHMHKSIDELDIGMLEKKNLKTMFRADDEMMMKNMSDQDAKHEILNDIVTKTSNILEATKNLEIMHDVYKSVKNIAEPFVKDMPSFNEVVNNKTMLDAEDYYKLMDQYGGIYTEYAFRAMKVERDMYNKVYRNSYLKFSDNVQSELRSKADMIYTLAKDPNVRIVANDLFRTFDGMNPLDSNFDFIHHKFLNEASKYIKTHNVDEGKYRAYLDALDEAKRMQLKVEMVDAEILGYRTKVAKDIAEKLGMTEHEIITAHKMANFMDITYKLNDKAETHLPVDYASEVLNLPTFDAVDATFTGATYFPRIMNEAGKAKLKLEKNLRHDYDPKTSMYKPRTYSDFFADPELRMSPMEELNAHLSRTKSSLTLRPMYKQLNKLKARRYGDEIMDSDGNVMSMKQYMEKVKNIEDAVNDPIAKNLDLIESQLDNIKSTRPDMGTTLNFADKFVGNVADIYTKYILSPVNPVFHAFNVGQAWFTLGNNVGYFNVLKGLPGGFGAAARHMTKQVYKHSDVTKIVIEDINKYKNKNTELGDHIARYLTEAYGSNQVRDHLAVLNNRGVVEESLSLTDKVTGITSKAAKAVQKSTDILTIPMVASDYGSRIVGMYASKEFVDSKLSKYTQKINSATTIKNAMLLRSELDAALQIDTFGGVVSKLLRDELTKALKSGDFTEFKYQYLKANVDIGMFQYGKYNRAQIADYLRTKGATPALISRFRSWGMYDRANTKRMFKQAFMVKDFVSEYKTAKATGDIETAKSARKKVFSSIKPLMMAAGSIASAYLVSKMMEHTRDDNNLKRIANNYYIGRQPLLRTVNTVEQITNDPTGMLSSTWRLMESMFSTGKDVYEGKSFNIKRFKHLDPMRLTKLDNLGDDLNEALWSAKLYIKDCVQAVEGSDEFREDVDTLYRFSIDAGVWDMIDDAKIEKQMKKVDEEIERRLKRIEKQEEKTEQ